MRRSIRHSLPNILFSSPSTIPFHPSQPKTQHTPAIPVPMCYLLRRHLCNCPAHPLQIPCTYSPPFLKSSTLLLPYSHHHSYQTSQQYHRIHTWEPYNRLSTLNSVCVHCAAIYNLLAQVNLPGSTGKHVEALMLQIRGRMFEREQGVVRHAWIVEILRRRG
ncbi:hypothetical protein G7Y79_00022g051250 [Physcia stellaris]|nr:hypothetical protein G7Y79_00022g051250 [Physcia stellaris]